MKPLCQDQGPGPALSSLSPDGASQPAGAPPPELGFGALAVVIDQAGIIVVAEPVCSPLFRWEPAELVGQPLEVLLQSGVDKIRQQLVPDQDLPDSDSAAPPRLFALARRKDDTSFAVAVTLHRQAGAWWAVAFHDVNPPPFAQFGTRAAGVSRLASTPRRRRAQVNAPPGIESIPDVFQRAPAPAPEPELPAPAPAAAPEPFTAATQTPLSQDQPAPGASPEQPVPAHSDARLQELEQCLSQNAAELQRTQAHLQRQGEQIHVANAAAQQAIAALEVERARCAQLEEQLAQARQDGDKLNSRLSAEQQIRADSEARLQALEQRLAQSQSAPSPAPGADEPPLQDQLLELASRFRTAVSSLARTTTELETERGERARSQQRATALAAQMQQLHDELKGHLASQQTDHQRLTELERQLHEQGQQNARTVEKLQSALQLEQCERKRFESELRRSRSLSTDSARAGRVLVNGLRRQLQPPTESLHQTACRLLQLQLPDDQKQNLQAMLENILLLQTSLQESPES